MTQSAVEQLKNGVMQVVRKVFPKMVADELQKLSREGVDNGDLRKDVEQLKKKNPTLTQAQIADRLGVSQGYVSRILRDDKPVSKKQVADSMRGSLQSALDKYGSRAKAAQALGIPRQTFSDRLAKESSKPSETPS